MEHNFDDELIRVNKEHLSSPISWDNYRNGSPLLPSADELLTQNNNSWKEVLKKYGASRKKRYTKEELIEIAITYQEKFTTVREWDSFASKLMLPKSSTYILHFGQWSEVGKILGKESGRTRVNTYTKEQIIQVLLEYKEKYTSPNEWDIFAKSNSLPTYKTIRSYLSYEELNKLVKSSIRKKYTHDELITIARQNLEYFKSQVSWNVYAKENKLPAATTYIRNFGSWKMAKLKVLSK
ncbi:hypothetical protein D5E69_23295 (plasmid) [Rossellomorea marisflavi]|uniref:hypothetical protein n=1 Tax=Rossellomorea marisflavi TaxID=189381 RepID=UPI00131939FD|nr:hypothetical protein [Rossellomorea marisflavi]QHA38759.1 hypothetical protein D5E69_23295 [Rossellomorea marisflavi]